MLLQDIFPFVALSLGASCSLYFLYAWLRHKGPRPRFLLYWAGTLFLMFWFQVPVILHNFGRSVTVTNFNFFFALTFPITFLALILALLGILDILQVRLRRRDKLAFCGWTAFAVLFFGYYFVSRGGVIDTYAMPIVGNLAFYLPIRIAIIFVIVREFFRRGFPSPHGTLGLFALVGESCLGIVRNILILKNVIAYPPQFWYIVLTSLDIFFILQTASVILFVLGFSLLHAMKCRMPAKLGT